jgi:GH43 family beta-xylosidase
MSARRVTRAAIEKSIACPHLELVGGDGYFYFAFDDEGTGRFETHSVYVNRLNDLPFEAWVEEGRAFAARMEEESKA